MKISIAIVLIGFWLAGLTVFLNRAFARLHMLEKAVGRMLRAHGEGWEE